MCRSCLIDWGQVMAAAAVTAAAAAAVERYSVSRFSYCSCSPHSKNGEYQTGSSSSSKRAENARSKQHDAREKPPTAVSYRRRLGRSFCPMETADNNNRVSCVVK